MKKNCSFLWLMAILSASYLSPSADNSLEWGGARTSGADEPLFSAPLIIAHIQRLSSDEFGGRAPGSKGESLTLSYLIEQYRKMGLKPGAPKESYLQEVPLVGTTLLSTPALLLKKEKDLIRLEYSTEFIAWTLRKEEQVTVRDAEIVFAGYGVVAPEYGWDDFKDTDLKGKVIVVLVGDPPLPDTTLFGGKAMTYYGRWTYKFEIAAEKGATGAIIVHNTEAAGYPWEVVANSWSGEQFDVVRADRGLSRCALEGWITEGVAERLFSLCGLSFSGAVEKALSKDFRPIPLGLSASITFKHSFRNVTSYNVAALLEGQDPKHREEVVIYTAHWDHLGKGKPVEGDSIYNGALDNASGVAGLLEITRAFSLGQHRRSVLFLNTTAEESGLLGSSHYAEHPLYPLEKTVAVINLDGLNIWGRTSDMVVVGYGYSTLDDYLAEVIESQERALKPDTEPEKGYYFRSDHFPFVKQGVPALYADSGVDYIGRPEGWGLRMRRKYTREKYHKPQDEFDPAWNLDGAIEDLQALYRVGQMLADTTVFPVWRENSEFKRIRDTSLKRR